mgnify:CR=1 FL=1
MSELSDRWHAVIEEWRASGLPGKTFCNERNIVYHQFGYWRRKHTHDQKGEAPVPTKFVPVAWSAPKRNSFGDLLELELPNGIVIRGVTDGNVDLVNRLLSRL